MNFPELPLNPKELPKPALRCHICSQPAAEALELLHGPVCLSCLQDYVQNRSLDTLSALLCAAVLTNDIPKED